MPAPTIIDENGMIYIAGPYRQYEIEQGLLKNIEADMNRPDKHGRPILWAQKKSREGIDIWRVPPPDLIDVHDYRHRYNNQDP